jgi:hypothetical protein
MAGGVERKRSLDAQRASEGNDQMNKYAIMTAALLVAGMISPAFADCDVHNADEDKQAKCAEKCDDEYLARKMNYGANQSEVRANKKACDAACGCPQNSKGL